MIMDNSLRAARRALIIFLAAVLVSVLAALTMIGSAALTRSRAWSVIGGLLVAALVSWILGSFILRRDSKAQRLVIGPLVVLGCAAVISLTWLYPGTGGVRPDPVAGVEWLDLPDGSRLALHVTRAAAARSRGIGKWTTRGSAVVGYRRAFPQAQLVMITDAGHVAYLEQPVVYTNLVRAFLAGQKLPLPTIDGTTIPDGYRGTR